MWAKIIMSDQRDNVVKEIPFPEDEMLGCYYSIESNNRQVIQLKKEYVPGAENGLENTAMAMKDRKLEAHMYVGETIFKAGKVKLEKFQIAEEEARLVEYLVLRVTQTL